MYVTQGDIARGRRKTARRNCEVSAHRYLALAPAEHRTVGEEVCHDNIHVLGLEVRRHRPEKLTHSGRVRLGPVLGGFEQRGGIAESTLGHERRTCHDGRSSAIATWDENLAALTGSSDFMNHANPDTAQKGCVRSE